MVKLIKQLIDLIIQPVKYHLGMRLKVLLERGAEYMGLSFDSSILLDEFWSDTVIIPSKYQSFDDGTDSGVLGFRKPDIEIQTGYYDGTFGDVLGIAQRLWNARVIISDGVIRLERVDTNITTSNYVLPAIETPAIQYNTDELKSNTAIRFSTDLGEPNTIDDFKGTFSDIIVEPLAIENRDMVLMRGLTSVEVGVALAKRKEKLTGPEKAVSAMVKAIAAVMSLVLKTIPKKNRQAAPLATFANSIEKRKGMMLLGNDFMPVAKIVSLDIGAVFSETKIKVSNATRMTSYGIYDEFHYVNSFVPSVKLPNPNQWIKRNHDSIRFCFCDYKLVKNNNLIFDSEGRLCKIISLGWNSEKETAQIEFWEQAIYTTNLKETIITPDGL